MQPLPLFSLWRLPRSPSLRVPATAAKRAGSRVRLRRAGLPVGRHPVGLQAKLAPVAAPPRPKLAAGRRVASLRSLGLTWR